MPYRVEQLDKGDISSDQCLEKLTLTSSVRNGSEIRSDLMLVHRKRLDSYHILITQASGGTSKSFVLFSSTKYKQAERDAFVSIAETLSPLLSNVAVTLSEPLLRAIILPEPLHPKLISSRLVSLMEHDPLANQDWDHVIQALMTKVEKTSKQDQERMKFRLTAAKLRHIGLLNAFVLPLSIAAPRVVTDVFELHSDSKTSNQIYTLSRHRLVRQFSFDYFVSRSRSMLMEAVEKEYMQSCMFLTLAAASRAEINQADGFGNTALHVAVEKGNLDLIKLLLAFHADPTIPNHKKQTPLDKAELLSNAEISQVLKHMKRLQAEARAYNDANLVSPKKQNNSKDIFLLSLDGGGLKVFNAIKVLMRIEERMKEVCPDCSPLQTYFDYVAGTSAGAAIAAVLFYGNELIQNGAIALYKFMKEVVEKPLEERLDHLKQYLFEHFGENRVLSDITDQRVLMMTTMANVSPNELHIMSSYGEPRDGQPGPHRRKLWEAIAATMAAPTYLPPFENFLDGGLVANNPTLTTMTEIFEHKEADQKLGCVLSIGTGFTPSVQFETVSDINLNFSISSLISSAVGLKHLIKHFMVQTTRSDGEIIRQARSWCNCVGASYFRFSTPLQKNVAMDSTDISDIISQLYDSEVYLLTEHVAVDQVAKKLLSK